MKEHKAGTLFFWMPVRQIVNPVRGLYASASFERGIYGRK